MLIRGLLCVLLALIGVNLTAVACDDDDENGLDVGLVLSGGGALASTQVGAIEFLDELGIPVHCVAGTSFGAVVGSFYSSGYTGEEIADIFRTSAWNDIIITGAERSSRSFLQKEQETEYFSGYFAGLDENGIRLPSGLSSMQELRAFFRGLLNHIPIDSEFDDIGLPFRAVATDLSDGSARAFERGDIVEAILASMAVPGAYAPRKIGDRYYVDGGMAANLPVETALAMGADIIIAIDTTIAPSDVEGQIDVAGVSQQLLQIVVYQKFQAQTALLDDDDILVKPSLEGLSVAGFANVEVGFQAGRAAMTAFKEQLLEIRSKAAPSTRQFLSREVREFSLDQIQVENDSRISDDRIVDRFRDDDEEDRVQRLRNLAAFGGFDEVDLARSGDGYRLSVSERDIGRTLLQSGIKASNTFDGDSKFSLLGRLTRTPFSENGGEIDASFEIGSDIGLQARLTYPFGRSGKFFVQPQIFYRGEEVLFDIGDLRVGEFWQERLGARVRFGRELGSWGAIGVETGAQWGELEAQVSLIEGFDSIDYRQSGIGAFLSIDTLDRLDWPGSGFKGSIKADRFFEFDNADAETDRYMLTGLIAKEIGPVGVIVNGQVEAVDNDNNDPIEVLRLGGFRKLSAYPENALPNDAYAYGSIELYRRLTRTDTIFALPIYAGFIAEYAEAEFDLFQVGAEDQFASAGLYLGADTPFGPLFFGAAIGQDDAASAFVYLGRSF